MFKNTIDKYKNIILIFTGCYNLIIVNTFIVFTNFFSEVFFLGLLKFSIICFVVIFIFFILFYKFSQIYLSQKIINFILIFIIILTIFSTLHSNTNSFILINNLKIVLLIKISLAMLSTIIITKYKLTSNLIVFSFIFLFTISTTLSFSLYNYYKNIKIQFKDNLIVSNSNNIFLITFDGLNSKEMITTIKNNQLEDQLNDFIFFPNFLSTHPSTTGSLSFEILGNKFNLSENLKTEDNLRKIVQNDKDNFFNRDGINKQVFAYYNQFLDKEELIDFNLPNTISFYKVVIEKYFRESLIRFFTYKIDKFVRIASNSYEQYEISKNQFLKYIEKLKNPLFVNSTSLHTGHWYFTHIPIIFNSDCKRLSLQKMNNFTYSEQLNMISECSFKMFIKFINQLKETGIYENSLIILKSDHGSTSEYFDQSDIRKISSNNSRYGYGRYKPFLMIKKMFYNDKLTINNSIIINSDISPYICNILNDLQNKFVDCKKYGFDFIKETIENKKLISKRSIDFYFDYGANKYKIEYLKKTNLDLNIEDFNSSFIEFFKQNNQ